MSDRIKITFFQKNDNKDSSVIATLGIYVVSTDWYYTKLKLIEKKDGTFFVAPPSEEFTNPQTGKLEYSNYWWLGKRSSDFFQKEVMKALDTYCTEKGIQNPIYGRSTT